MYGVRGACQVATEMVTSMSTALLFLFLWPSYPVGATIIDAPESGTSSWSNTTMASSGAVDNVNRDLQFLSGKLLGSC